MCVGRICGACIDRRHDVDAITFKILKLSSTINNVNSRLPNAFMGVWLSDTGADTARETNPDTKVELGREDPGEGNTRW